MRSRTDGDGTGGAGTGGSSTGGTGTGGAGTAGTGTGGAGTGGSGTGGAGTGGGDTGGTAGTGGSELGGNPGFGGSSGAGGVTGPTDCSSAVAPYEVSVTPVSGSPVPVIDGFHWGGEYTNLPVAIGPDGVAYVGLSFDDGGTLHTGVVAETGGGTIVDVSGARIGAFTTTSDGFGLLLFEPVEVDQRRWASVGRYGTNGQELFNVDLFRSANLDDLETRGEPATGRIEYLTSDDELLAYFGHTNRFPDDPGVRHEGGYVATVDSAGAIQVHGDWFGSHNLDQRIDVRTADDVLLLGLGDAYPEGVFADRLADNVNPQVLNGILSAQLGDMVPLSDRRVITLIGGYSFWDVSVDDGAPTAAQLGLMTLPTDGGLGLLSINYLPTTPEAGGRMTYLKSAPYGPGDLILLAWKEREAQGSPATFYTMVVDADGNVCQPKQTLDGQYEFLGDDFAVRPNGEIVWANAQGGQVNLVTLTPG